MTRVMTVAQPNPDRLTRVLGILDLARWAPSGDNSQPWRFEIVNERRVIIHGKDTRDWCVYDLDGRASQIAIGSLVETVAIAATKYGMRASFSRCLDTRETQPTIIVSLRDTPNLPPDPLVDAITRRTTQRRPLSTTPLTASEKRILENSVGSEFNVRWFERPTERWRLARLLFRNAGVRLRLPEAYAAHARIIDWDQDFSVDKIPATAIGMSSFGLAMMRWAMRDWQRVQFLNRYLLGTMLPRLELDLLPALRCAAHVMVAPKAQDQNHTVDTHLATGRAMQRLWLTACHIGLQFQPQMTPLIFSRYLTTGRHFTADIATAEAARRMVCALDEITAPVSASHIGFMGRIGTGPVPTTRSIRRPLPEMLVD